MLGALSDLCTFRIGHVTNVFLTIKWWKQLCWYKRGSLQSKNGSCYSSS